MTHDKPFKMICQVDLLINPKASATLYVYVTVFLQTERNIAQYYSLHPAIGAYVEAYKGDILLDFEFRLLCVFSLQFVVCLIVQSYLG